MPDALQWLLGLKQVPDWASGGSWQIQFQSRPEGLWAVACAALAVAAVVGVWYLYRTENSTVQPIVRWALIATRLLVLLCAAFMLLELVFVITKRESIPSRLLVLVDTSESMGLRDPYRDDDAHSRLSAALELQNPAALRGEPRLDLARRTLDKILPALSTQREVSLFGFAQQPAALSNDALKSATPQGPGTAIGTAISHALAEHRGQPLAGVLVLSDGQSNSGEDARKAAEQAAKQGVPIVSLAVGTEEGPSNARLAAIEADPVVFVRDAAEVNVLVEGHGLQGRTGVVSLEKRQDSSWTDVGREEITFDDNTGARRLSFRITPDVVGEIEFRARVSELGSELTDADNFATHSMKVVRQQIRVLLVAGAPSPEVQFLRNSLMRDTGLEFACWLQPAGDGYEQMGTRAIRRLPANRQELEQYDVVVLFDPDMRALGPAWSDLISQFVGTAGGGLVVVAGEMHTRNLFDGVASDGGDASGSTINNTWLRTLPVVADPGLYRSNAEVALSALEPWNLELTAEGAIDPIFVFDADPGRNREILASLPGMFWHFPVTRSKPGATVLARHGDPRMRNAFGRHVLFAMHRYGPGHAAFLGFDSTYRWRYLHEEYFDGFWARLIDRVGRSKALGGRYPFTLSTDQSVYRTGDRVTISARSADDAETSGAVLDLKGEIELAGQPPTPLEIEPLADRPGTAQATFTPGETGVYSVRVLPGSAAAEGDSAIRPATLSFRVEPAHSELDRPKLDRALLEDLARAGGGAVFPLTEFERVPSAFKVKEVQRVLEYRDEMWDAPIVFGSLMALLTLEWLLRKRSRMA
ncbi:MAG: VWA domain-containing protein [Pirellulales bacterium]